MKLKKIYRGIYYDIRREILEATEDTFTINGLRKKFPLTSDTKIRKVLSDLREEGI